jgi:1-acyl-sn-glycerol-3-phosphate acyltransferase
MEADADPAASAEATTAPAATMTAALSPPRDDRPTIVPPAAPEPSAATAGSAPEPSNVDSVREMERDLQGLLSDVDGAAGDADARQRAAEAIGRIAARLYSDPPPPMPADDGLLTGARQFLSSDYYLRQLGRFGLRGRSEHVDDFGLDPAYEARVQPLLDAVYTRYFRVQVEGAERIPSEGGVMLVCNHSGALPWDGVMLKAALRHAHPERRTLRWLTDDFVFHSPFLGAWLNRIGAVRACPENAERLLERGELLAVFPEGVKGITKPFRDRYQLQRFGRGGHIKLALRAKVPVIPVAIVGGEETYPVVYRVRAFAKALGLPYIPVTPLFPWLGPLGLLPLPSRWHISIGEPLRELEGLDAYAAEDGVVVNDLNEQLRASVQRLVQDALRTRGPNAFF